jgi:hypothetical protein
MHMASNGGTCHTVCALWIPELGLRDPPQGKGSEASAAFAASSYQVV